MKRLLLLLIVVSVSTAHARLGESPFELEKRFGKAILTNGGSPPAEERMQFTKNGYSINVELAQKKAVMIRYVKKAAEPLTEDEIKELQSANANAFHEEWKQLEVRPNSSCKIWIRSDRPAYCILDGDRELTFCSVEFWKKNYAKNYDNLTPSTKGF